MSSQGIQHTTYPLALLICLSLIAYLTSSLTVSAADWQTDNWHVVSSSLGEVRRPAPIRNIVRTEGGQLLGTRPTGSSIELWSSDNNGIDWSSLGEIAQSNTVSFGDSTLTTLDNGELLAGYRELHPTLGWSVRVSRSVDAGQSWSFGGTIQDWTSSENEFVGAPHFHQLTNGALQAYYDSEFVAPGGGQYIALKDGQYDALAGIWNWSNERIVNTAGVGSAGVRDGLATVVNLGPDLDGDGDRLMVVTEAIGVVQGQSYNLIRAFQVQNGGASQTDWDNLLDSRVVYQSPLSDPAGHQYNAYAPYAVRVGGGPVMVAFSTDEVLHTSGQPADAASAPVDLRHSEIKFVQTTANFETWSEASTLWGVDHPDFAGDLNSGDIRNYQIGLIELSDNDLLATLDMFSGRQLVFRPSLGGLTADFNKNAAVNGADFLIWQQGLGLTDQTIAVTGDATGDGKVDSADFEKWRQQYGAAAVIGSSVTLVPEPTSWSQVLAFLMLAALVHTRRRTSRERSVFRLSVSSNSTG